MATRLRDLRKREDVAWGAYMQANRIYARARREAYEAYRKWSAAAARIKAERIRQAAPRPEAPR